MPDATSLETPSMNGADKELFTQSWTHYRHLEDQRQKMLVFFSTFILAGLTACGLLLKSSDSTMPNSAVYLFVYGLASLICTFGLISIIYIIKSQAARSAYGALIDSILRRSYQSAFDESYRKVFYSTLQINTPKSLRTLLTCPKPLFQLGASGALIDQGVFTIFVFLGVSATAIISAFAIPFSPLPIVPLSVLSSLYNLAVAKTCWDHIQTKQPSIVEYFDKPQNQ